MGLYYISQEYRAALARLEDTDGEMDAEMEAAIDGIASAFADKADAYCCLTREMDAQADALDAEAARIRARSAALVSRARWLRDRLKAAMLETGTRTLRTKLWSISIGKGQPHVEITGVVPDEYTRRHDPEPDKQKILLALKSGASISGASLVEGEPVLRVR